jgi:hypothetical protein
MFSGVQSFPVDPMMAVTWFFIKSRIRGIAESPGLGSGRLLKPQSFNWGVRVPQSGWFF